MSSVKEDGDGLAMFSECLSQQLQRWLFIGRQMGKGREEDRRRHGEEQWQER